jgi:hypothetical protein
MFWIGLGIGSVLGSLTLAIALVFAVAAKDSDLDNY